MSHDCLHYSSYLQAEIARARAQRDLAVATLVLDAIERIVRGVMKLVADATRARA
ncbi:MAG TPA: hypothetical protein VKR38_15255 [Usitatibacter sp.]|nr:hypothetical protein [Usitatibacter sp.]